MDNKSTSKLFQLWLITGIACFLLMLLHQSMPATILGRYSTGYAITLLIVLGTIILAAIGWYLAENDLLEPFIIRSQLALWIILFASLASIVMLWLFMPGSVSPPAIVLFRVYLVTIIAGLALFYLHSTKDLQTILNTRVWLFVSVFGGILALVLTGIYLGKVPASLYYDEPLVANFGWTCASTGVPGVQMLPPRDTVYFNVLLPMAYCVPGILMKLFGSTLTVARTFGIITIWLATPFVYLTAKRLYNSSAAVIAALIMLLFALSHNHLRSDPYVTLVLAIALYTYTRAQTESNYILHFITGFILATVIEGHQLGVRFILIFTLLYVWQYWGIIRSQKRFVFYNPFFVFALGGLSYLPIFYFIHIVWWGNINLFDFISLVQEGYDEQLTVGSNFVFWQRITRNLETWFVQYPIYHPSEVMILFVGLATAIWRRQKAERFLAYLFISSFVIYILISPKHTPYYWVHNLPIIALLASNFVYALFQKANTRLVSIFPIFVLLCFFTVQIVFSSKNTQNADTLMSISVDINANLPDELQTVTGHQVYFWGLSNRRFYDANSFSSMTVYEVQESYNINLPQAVIRSIGIDDHPALLQYIEEEAMIAVRCYSTDFFGGTTILYVLPEFVDEIPQQVCNESESQ